MDSLTTTGDGEAKTMTSDSGEQQRHVPFMGSASCSCVWSLWMPGQQVMRLELVLEGWQRVERGVNKVAQIALCHWQFRNDRGWSSSGLWMSGVQEC